ncbi:hypothetical protein JST97_30550 [bacterium]|nr:hypothetical protein [bacterium]
MGDWQYIIRRSLIQTPITDIQTHLFDPAFKGLTPSGLDELLTSPDLVNQTLRTLRFDPTEFARAEKAVQAATVWQTLFIDRLPMSEACRSVLVTLQSFGMDLSERRLEVLREKYPVEAWEQVLGTAGVARLVMTNDPFDDKERAAWQAQPVRDVRFFAGLQLDTMVHGWKDNFQRLKPWGYQVSANITTSQGEIQRFLDIWLDRTLPIYVSLTLPVVGPECNQMLHDIVLATCARRGIAVNCLVRTGGLNDLSTLLARYHNLRFLARVESFDEEASLALLGNRFPNLLIYGWPRPGNLELMRSRVLSQGLTFVPQPSGARVLEELIARWTSFKPAAVDLLANHYTALEEMGYQVDQDLIEKDLKDLLGQRFWTFLGRE